jgi:amidophosphoribosyltransferase
MCGIIGVFNQEREAAPDLYVGLYALQHRGKESCRIVTFNGERFYSQGGMGEIPIVFKTETLRKLSGKIGIAHNRYSTSSFSDPKNIQPIQEFWRSEEFWLAHNGNLINADEIRERCLKQGKSPVTPSDSGAIATLISLSRASSFEEAVKETVKELKGAFSLVILKKDKIIALRDNLGFKPLHLGKRKKDWLVTSETCALYHLGALHEREIEPGEIVLITKSGVEKYWQFKSKEKRYCIFEYIYFQRPDSIEKGRRICDCRENMGKILAKKSPVLADLVIPIPDSGLYGGIGFIEESGIESGIKVLFRPHIFSRTFIEPVQSHREKGIELKLVILGEKVKGKRIVIVDDSIVRGTTTKKIVGRLRKAGAKEIHVRVHSPPYRFPCYFGIDTWRVKDELIAARHKGDVEKIREEIGADSLCYLEIESVIKAIRETPGQELKENEFCTACFTGTYPIKPKSK